MAKKQYFGLKYPFTAQDFENYFVDLNSTMKDKVRSQLMHVIFTPKGQRIRDPEFGTDLIRYIFEQNDTSSWTSVKNEVSEAVQRYVNNITVKDINIVQSEDDRSEIFVRIDYSVKEGNKITNDSIIAKI
jgi:phage baseplate assembly protein W